MGLMSCLIEPTSYVTFSPTAITISSLFSSFSAGIIERCFDEVLPFCVGCLTLTCPSLTADAGHENVLKVLMRSVVSRFLKHIQAAKVGSRIKYPY